MVADSHSGELRIVSGTLVLNLVTDTSFWPYQNLDMPVPSTTQV